MKCTLDELPGLQTAIQLMKKEFSNCDGIGDINKLRLQSLIECVYFLHRKYDITYEEAVRRVADELTPQSKRYGVVLEVYFGSEPARKTLARHARSA